MESRHTDGSSRRILYTEDADRKSIRYNKQQRLHCAEGRPTSAELRGFTGNEKGGCPLWRKRPVSVRFRGLVPGPLEKRFG